VLFLKCEVHRCDFLQFFVHFYSQVLFIESFNFNFGSQYILLGLILCNSSNITYYNVILCHKVMFVILLRLIAIKNFSRAINHD